MQLNIFYSLPDVARQGIITALGESLTEAVARRDSIADELALADKDVDAIRKALATIAIAGEHDEAIPSEVVANVGEQPNHTPVLVNPLASVRTEAIQPDWSRDKKLVHIINDPAKYGYSLFDRASIVEVIRSVEQKAVNKVGIKKYGEAIGQALSKLAQRGIVAKYVKRSRPDSLPTSTYYVSREWIVNNAPLPAYEVLLAGLELVSIEPSENRTAPVTAGAELELK